MPRKIIPWYSSFVLLQLKKPCKQTPPFFFSNGVFPAALAVLSLDQLTSELFRSGPNGIHYKEQGIPWFPRGEQLSLPAFLRRAVSALFSLSALPKTTGRYFIFFNLLSVRYQFLPVQSFFPLFSFIPLPPSDFCCGRRVERLSRFSFVPIGGLRVLLRSIGNCFSLPQVRPDAGVSDASEFYSIPLSDRHNLR